MCSVLKHVLLFCRLTTVLGSLASFSKISGSSDDDWIDRLNHLWTVVLMTLFAVVTSSGQYAGNPIECWVPAEFTGAYTSYAKSYCWISNTYYVPQEEPIPHRISDRYNQELTYYQWVPIILMFQALMFKVPNIVWRMMNGQSGVNMERIIALSENGMMGDPDDRMKNISHLAKYLNRWIETHREYRYNFIVKMREKYSNVLCFCCGKRDGTFLTGFYIFIKFLYCANVVGQFFILNAFMATDFNMFGFEVIENFIYDRNWRESPRFPRVTLCDFKIRQLANVQIFTVQCVLPINLFNEKIFIFLWFWFFIVAALSFGNLFHWIYQIVFGENKVTYVRKYLKVAGEIHTNFDKKLSRKFAEHYLRSDGIFVLRMVGKNTSAMFMTDLVQLLWKTFKEEHCSMKNGVTEVEETPLMNGNCQMGDMEPPSLKSKL